MKTFLRLFLFGAIFAAHAVAAPKPTPPGAPGGASITVHATIPPDAGANAAFFTSVIETEVEVRTHSVQSVTKLSCSVLQGEVSAFLFTVCGEGKVAGVEGANVASWSVLKDQRGVAYLNIRTKTPATGKQPFAAKVLFHAKNSGSGFRYVNGLVKVPLLASAGVVDAAGVAAVPSAGNAGVARQLAGEGVVRVRVLGNAVAGVVAHSGLVSIVPEGADRFAFMLEPAASRHDLQLRVGVYEPAVVLEDFMLRGELSPDGKRLHFKLDATAHVRDPGEPFPLLRGEVALGDLPGPSYSTMTANAQAPVMVAMSGSKVLSLEEVSRMESFYVTADADSGPLYRLHFKKAGEFKVSLEFDARLTVDGDSTSVDFSVFGAQVGRFTLEGFPEDAQFQGEDVVVRKQEPFEPAGTKGGPVFHGFFPADGTVRFAWSRAKAEGDDARLFFSTEEISDIVVRPGVLGQGSRFRYKILQGKLDTLRFALAGNGEILRVSGADILSWNVVDADAGRRHLVVRLAQPQGGDYGLVVEAQAPLGDFPLRMTPLAVAPLDGVRHSGFVRVRNEGAVRLEPTPLRGLTQVAPALFPENKQVAKGAQQFVYRIASADTAMEIQAENILPEVSVHVLATYQITESDTLVDVELELDVREAPLAEYTIRVPAAYSVIQNTSASWQYTLGAPKDGYREMRLTFAKALQERALLSFRLESLRGVGKLSQASAAAPAQWELQRLEFPGAKSVRGYIGVASAPGLRVTSGVSDGVIEIATATFPKKHSGLQQAYRLRDPAQWKLVLAVEKLGLAVHSDGLHLFAVREGLVSASTTINYAIVGAPLGTFRFAIPAGANNLEFVGRDIRAWKREGDAVEVNLHKPVSGAFTLLGTYDLPLGARGGEISLAGLQPLDVQSEQGFTLVTSNLQFDLKPGTLPPSMTSIEPGEIPPEHRMMFDAPLLAAYQYTSRPSDLRLHLNPRPVGVAVSQTVDFASLRTRLSQAGQVITEARYLVKSHGHPHLRVSAPAGLKIWAARVDGTDVQPVTENNTGTTLVPLPSRPDANAILDVDLRFGGIASDSVKIRLDAPRIGAPVINTRWEITPDKGRSLTFLNGNLSPANEPPTQPDLPQVEPKPMDGHTKQVLGATILLALLGAFAFSLALRLRNAGRRRTAIAGGALALVLSFGAAVESCHLVRNLQTVVPQAPAPPLGGEPVQPVAFTTPILAANGGLFLELKNEAADAAAGSGIGTLLIHVLCLALVLALAFRAWRRKSILARALAWTVAVVALFAVHETHLGWLALVLGAFFVVEIVLPGLRCFLPLKVSPGSSGADNAGMPQGS
jgi:hypothetical protein